MQPSRQHTRQPHQSLHVFLCRMLLGCCCRMKPVFVLYSSCKYFLLWAALTSLFHLVYSVFNNDYPKSFSQQNILKGVWNSMSMWWKLHFNTQSFLRALFFLCFYDHWKITSKFLETFGTIIIEHTVALAGQWGCWGKRVFIVDEMSKHLCSFFSE